MGQTRALVEETATRQLRIGRAHSIAVLIALPAAIIGARQFFPARRPASSAVISVSIRSRHGASSAVVPCLRVDRRRGGLLGADRLEIGERAHDFRQAQQLRLIGRRRRFGGGRRRRRRLCGQSRLVRFAPLAFLFLAFMELFPCGSRELRRSLGCSSGRGHDGWGAADRQTGAASRGDCRKREKKIAPGPPFRRRKQRRRPFPRRASSGSPGTVRGFFHRAPSTICFAAAMIWGRPGVRESPSSVSGARHKISPALRPRSAPRRRSTPRRRKE